MEKRPRPPSPSDATRVTVFQIMSREVICMKPETTVESLRAILVENGISGAPVVDDNGKIVGIVSITDVVRDQHERGETLEHEDVRLPSGGGVTYSPGPGFRVLDGGTSVAEVMSPKVITIKENTTLAEASALMAKNHVHRLPVVSDAGKVVGLVSSLDILGWVAGLS
ncbi:MAG: CBS domain-containing protein [Archangium sp.]|nr:CBS domain-containing protein [Archangium sp.]